MTLIGRESSMFSHGFKSSGPLLGRILTLRFVSLRFSIIRRLVDFYIFNYSVERECLLFLCIEILDRSGNLGSRSGRI